MFLEQTLFIFSAIKNINGKLSYIISIIDRDEGGYNFFKKLKIKYYPVVTINNNFLKKLLRNNIINKDQKKLILSYKKNPTLFGKNYFLKNSEFLLSSLKDKKNSIKAQRCINENIYKLDFSKKPFNSLKNN